MTTDITPYGRTQHGEDVHSVTIADGLRAEILTYGGVIARLEVPDGTGGRRNVVLGLTTLRDYETRSPSFGATIGRYAGRIAGGRFSLGGTDYTLPQNDGGNTLHGGLRGFGKRVWRIEHAEHHEVRLGYTSVDGEEGFPGTLDVAVTFTITGATLRLHYEARTDRATPLNLTNHSYFNLAGEGSGDVFSHGLQVEADQILELDAASIPTGTLLDVDGTPFDFRKPQPIGLRLRDAHPQIVMGLGYDAAFVIRGTGMRRAATLRTTTGRAMSVRTDRLAVQIYTANKLTGALVGPSGRAYRSGDAVCFETQAFPDAPNHPHFPSTILDPGDVFRSTTEYEFHAG